MTREESRQRRALALEAVKSGKTFKEAADISGFGTDYVRQICAKEGIRKERTASYNCLGVKKRDLCLELLKQGATTETILKETGYASVTSVYKVAKAEGLDTTTERHEKKLERDEEIRQYVAAGHTRQQASKKYGLALTTVENICQGIGATVVNQYEYADRETIAKKWFEKYEGFEYAGGFTHSEGRVDVRCLTCGHVFSRSMISIRHNDGMKCPACEERRLNEKAEAEKQARQHAEEERAVNSLNRRLKKLQDRQRWEASRRHPCPVCGTETTNKVYCSNECAKKVYNAAHEAKRRAKIESQMVDKDVTLKRLYKKDRGVCHICGGICDWNDKEIRNGVVISGNSYPSIDHVIPLSRGGEHSWKNVKLAHRLCNTLKGASL